jgi:hypothetical protein
MRGARLRRSARSLRCLLPCLGQAVRSKDRCERGVGGGARRTGFPDGPRSSGSSAQWPMPHSPRCGADVERDRSCSFSSRTRASGELDVIFSVAGTVDPGPVKICHDDFRGQRPRARLCSDRIFTYRRIYRAPDCARRRPERIFQTVTLSTATRLSDDEKLEALRWLDQFRQWDSLDEKRYCLVCGKLISGRQIQVAGGARGNGPLRLSCPTETCNSIPMDWVLPTNEILAKVEKLAEEERGTSALKPNAATNGNGKTVHAGREHEHFASRLRKFAFHFKRHA